MKTYKITYKVGNVEYAVIAKLEAENPEEAHEIFVRPPNYIEKDQITRVEELE